MTLAASPDPLAVLTAAQRRVFDDYHQADSAIAVISCALVARLVRAAHPDAQTLPMRARHRAMAHTGWWIGPRGAELPLVADYDAIDRELSHLDVGNHAAWEPLCERDLVTGAYALRLHEALSAADQYVSGCSA